MRVTVFIGAAVIAVALTGIVEAHVRIGPLDSRANSTQTYTVRVPAEGTIATTSLELEIPDGLAVVSVNAPAGTSYELKKKAGAVVGILWTMNLQPGSVTELSFVAKNPGPGQVLWKAHQHFADGTVNHYDGPAGSRRPAVATTLTR